MADQAEINVGLLEMPTTKSPKLIANASEADLGLSLDDLHIKATAKHTTQKDETPNIDQKTPRATDNIDEEKAEAIALDKPKENHNSSLQTEDVTNSSIDSNENNDEDSHPGLGRETSSLIINNLNVFETLCLSLQLEEQKLSELDMRRQNVHAEILRLKQELQEEKQSTELLMQQIASRVLEIKLTTPGLLDELNDEQDENLADLKLESKVKFTRNVSGRETDNPTDLSSDGVDEDKEHSSNSDIIKSEATTDEILLSSFRYTNEESEEMKGELKEEKDIGEEEKMQINSGSSESYEVPNANMLDKLYSSTKTLESFLKHNAKQ